MRVQLGGREVTRRWPWESAHASSSSPPPPFTHLHPPQPSLFPTVYYPSTLSDTARTMSEEIVLPIPNLKLAQNYFVLSSPHLSHLHEDARKVLLEGIKADRTRPSTFI